MKQYCKNTGMQTGNIKNILKNIIKENLSKFNIKNFIFDITPYVIQNNKQIISLYEPISDIIKIPKGLVLFHLAIHKKDINFLYPKPGSFFAPTPTHSLSLGFAESEFKPKIGKMRLLTYITTKEILAEDKDGDKFDCKIISNNIDSAFPIDSYSEIKICGNIENYLQIIDEIIINGDLYSKISNNLHPLYIGNEFPMGALTPFLCFDKFSFVNEELSLVNVYLRNRLLQIQNKPLISMDYLIPMFSHNTSVYVKGNPYKGYSYIFIIRRNYMDNDCVLIKPFSIIHGHKKLIRETLNHIINYMLEMKEIKNLELIKKYIDPYICNSFFMYKEDILSYLK